MAKRHWERGGDMRHASESSSNGSWHSQETIKQDLGTRAPPIQVRTGMQDRYDIWFFILISPFMFLRWQMGIVDVLVVPQFVIVEVLFFFK
jgi:hypothetical protein